ncbi:MAG TPA: hypothetical protein VEA99_14195 [Gemmatimonadaceae bacterium]|nr:hypothetical protein [Gemmatimonadaceae bacterium]
MPNPIDFRARSVTEIVDGAVQLYKRDALHYILIAAVASAPGVILQLVASGGTDATTGPTFGGMMFVALFISLLGSTLMSAVLVHFASAVYLGGEADVQRSLRVVVSRLGSLVVNALVKWPLIILGTMLLLAPGLYLFTRWFATTPTIVLEGRGPFAAFGRSSTLSKGRKRRVFGTLFLVYLLFWLGLFGLMSVTGGFGDDGSLLTQVLYAVYGAIVYPIVGIAEMLLYYDARIRAEAFDVEVLASGLPTAREGSPQPQG